MSLTRKIIALTTAVCLLSVYTTYMYCKQSFRTELKKQLSLLAPPEKPSTFSDIKVHRLDGYTYIKPLLYVDNKEGSQSLANLKTNITNRIEEYKKAGVLQSASVFLKVYHKGEWLSINDTESYLPGSLIKIAGLLTYLRMEEVHPGVLDKQLTFESSKEFIPVQTYNSKQIQLGKTYTVRQLLKYMVAYSDNNATYLLNKNVDNTVFQKLFADLNIPLKATSDGNIKINVRDYSLFLRILFNASYLSIDHSEFAAELLAQCDFDKGMNGARLTRKH